MDNIDHFKNYMNKIKADTELKENTKNYVREALSDREQKTKRHIGSFLIKDFFSKKVLAPVCSVAACVLLSIAGYAYYTTPVNFVSLDINPSVELGVNALDKVVSAEGINDDGKSLVKRQKIAHMSVGDAINALVTEASEQNYISEDGSTIIAITVESENNRDVTNLQRVCEKGIQSALGSMNRDAVIYKGSAGLSIRAEAEDLDISPGKLKLIQYLQTLDPDVSVGQYRDSSISEIISEANKLLTEDGFPENTNGKPEGIAGEILEAAEQLKKARDESSEGTQDINHDKTKDDGLLKEDSDN